MRVDGASGLAADGPAGRRIPTATWARIAGGLLLAATAFATPGFLATPSILALLTTLSFVGCVAVAMTLITVSGNIMAFSLGATVAASSVLFVTVLNWAGLGPAVLGALAFGTAVTAAQGLAIGAFRANPIIVSIATLALIYGVAQAATGGGSIYASPGAGHEVLKGRVAGIPMEFLAFLLVLIVAQFLLSFSAFGRNVIMVGSSLRAAEAAGIRTWRTVAGAYAWAGVFTAVPGIMLAVRYGSANMEYGLGYDYDAIAAVLVGGTAIQGGHGSALRTFVGVLVIAAVQVILLLHGFRQEWQYLIAGVIVLGVIVLQGLGRRH